MGNLFTRIKDSVTADINEVLDRKEEKNPIKMLNQYLRECEKETEKVRQLVERQCRLKNELSVEYDEAKKMAKKRAYQVEVAAKAGEVELYDFALLEKNQYEERANRLEAAIGKVRKQLDELQLKYTEMKHKLKNMQIRRMELMGRENMANANKRVYRVLEENNRANKSQARFDEIEGYLSKLEDQVKKEYYRNTIDAKIAELEKQEKNEESHSIS